MFEAKVTLLRLMNLPSQFIGVCRTSDGFYLGKLEGDFGYDRFIGAPQPVHNGPGLENTLRIWGLLSEEEQKAVRLVAAAPVDGLPIPLRSFGIPDMEVT